jgi:biofilm protein TabA
MIVVDIANAERQIAPSEGMWKAMAFLQRQDLPSLPDGKTEIDGDRVFAITQRYRTEAVDAPKFEYH